VQFSDKQLAYGAIAVGVIGLLLSLTFAGNLVGLIGAILIGVGTLFAILFLKYGYIVVPLLTQFTKVIVITDSGYEIPPTQDVIVKKEGDLYYASIFLNLKIYESSLEKSDEAIMNYNKFFERAMANFKKIVKVAYMMQSIDVTERRKELETKKAEAQLRLQKEKEKTEPDTLRLDHLEREVAYWTAQIDKLTLGLRPMKVLIYAMLTEVGITKDEAIAKAKSAGNELKTLLANSLNADVDYLTADEMLKVFEWEKFMPITLEELESKTQEQNKVF